MSFFYINVERKKFNFFFFLNLKKCTSPANTNTNLYCRKKLQNLKLHAYSKTKVFLWQHTRTNDSINFIITKSYIYMIANSTQIRPRETKLLCTVSYKYYRDMHTKCIHAYEYQFCYRHKQKVFTCENA